MSDTNRNSRNLPFVSSSSSLLPPHLPGTTCFDHKFLLFLLPPQNSPSSPPPKNRAASQRHPIPIPRRRRDKQSGGTPLPKNERKKGGKRGRSRLEIAPFFFLLFPLSYSRRSLSSPLLSLEASGRKGDPTSLSSSVFVFLSLFLFFSTAGS